MAITVDTKNKVESNWHPLKSEEGIDDPAEFKLYAVKGSRLDEIMEGVNFDNWPPLTAKGIQKALIYGVKDCKNVNDSNGDEVKFSPPILESLVWGDRVDLAMAVLDKSKLSDEEKKT